MILFEQSDFLMRNRWQRYAHHLTSEIVYEWKFCAIIVYGRLFAMFETASRQHKRQSPSINIMATQFAHTCKKRQKNWRLAYFACKLFTREPIAPKYQLFMTKWAKTIKRTAAATAMVAVEGTTNSFIFFTNKRKIIVASRTVFACAAVLLLYMFTFMNNACTKHLLHKYLFILGIASAAQSQCYCLYMISTSLTTCNRFIAWLSTATATAMMMMMMLSSSLLLVQSPDVLFSLAFRFFFSMLES